jgi:membrane protease YdiL (CAAX protease family)
MNATSSASRRIQIAIGLLLALGLPFCHLGDLGRKYSGLGPLFGGEVLWWILFAVVLLYVLFVERLPLSSLGFRRPGLADIAIAVGAGIVAVVGIGLIFVFVLPALHLDVTRQMNSMLQAPFWFRVLIVTRAAIAEETLFRGYGIERIEEATGSRLLAAAATWALFTAAHLSSWGLGSLIVAGFGGLVLTLLYLWRRNLWVNIIAHWLADAAGFLMPHG